MNEAALPIFSLFPFLYFMVKDFHIAKTEKDIGYYAGFIGSSFMCGRFLTSSHWGKLADKYGRIPIFFIVTISTIIFNTIFGLSRNYWMAIASRFILGSSSGVLGPVRAYVAEICSEEYHSFGMSVVGSFWGLGSIIGPALGGYLAQPSIKYPKMFPKGSLFNCFPYLLPCLCISLILTLALVTIYWLPESLHKHPKEILNAEIKGSYPKDEEDKVDQGQLKSAMATTSDSSKCHEHENTREEKSIIFDKGFLAANAVFSVWGLHDIAYTEIFSLWAVSPEKYGGLAFTTSAVGVVLAVSGAALVISQLLLFAPITNVIGPIFMVQASTVLSIPLVSIYPLISRFQGRTLWAILVSASMLKAILSDCVVNACLLLLNNSVSMNQRGFANGISMASISIFKAIGPTFAGILFSWSEKQQGASFLPGTWMVFIILAIGCLITIIPTLKPFLPRSLNKPKIALCT